MISLSTIQLAVIGKWTSEVIKTNSQLQTTQMALEHITGSAQKASDAINFAGQMGAGSILDNHTIEMAITKWAAFGRTGKDVEETLQNISDSVTVRGFGDQEFTAISNALLDVDKYGRASSGTITAFASANIDLLGVLEKRTGQSRRNLNEFIATGGMTAKTFHELFDDFLTGDAAGGSGKAAATLSGSIILIQKAISNLVQSGGAEVFSVIAKHIKDIASILNDNEGNKLGRLIESMVILPSDVDTIVKTIEGMADGVSKAISDHPELFVSVGKVVLSLFWAAIRVAFSATSTVAAFPIKTTMAALFNAFVQGVQGFAGYFDHIGQLIIDGLKTAFQARSWDELGKKFATLLGGSFINNLRAGITATFMSVGVPMMLRIFADLFGLVAALFVPPRSKLKTIGENAVGAIGEGAEPGNNPNMVTTLTTAIKNVFGAVADALINTGLNLVFGPVGAEIIKKIAGGVDPLSAVDSVLHTNLKGFFENLRDNFQFPDLGKMARDLLGAIGTAMGTIVQTAGDTIGLVTAIGNQIISAIGKFIATNGTWAVNAGKEALKSIVLGMGGIVQSIGDGIGLITSISTAIYDAIGKYVANTGNNVLNAAKEILKGIANAFPGIVQAIGDAIGLATSISAAIYDAIGKYVANIGVNVTNTAKAILIAIANGFATFTQSLGDAIGLATSISAAVYDAIGKYVANVGINVSNTARNILIAIANGFGTFGQSMGDAIGLALQISTAIYNAIGLYVSNTGFYVTNTAKNILIAIVNGFNTFSQSLGDTIGLATAISTAIYNAIGLYVYNVGMKVSGAAVEVLKSIIKALPGIDLNPLRDAIDTAVGAAMEFVTSSLGGVVLGAGTVASSIMSAISSALGNVVGGIQATEFAAVLRMLSEEVLNILGIAFNWSIQDMHNVNKTFGNVYFKLKGALIAIVTELASNLPIPEIKILAEYFLDAFGKALNDATSGASNAMKNIINAVVDHINSTMKWSIPKLFVSGSIAGDLTASSFGSMQTANTLGTSNQSGPGGMATTVIIMQVDGRELGRIAWNYMKNESNYGATMGLSTTSGIVSPQGF
jgi:hypothetical protein